jgi:23S rRNA (cytosine1962-C5)-methyltransferase
VEVPVVQAVARLKPRRERSVLKRHPWIYSGAVAAVQGQPAAGETVEVTDAAGAWLARGAYSPESQIRIRLWTWKESESVDGAFLAERVRRAVARRRESDRVGQANAYREVHAESDGLPGLIVDRYAEFRVIQVLSAGAECWRDALVEALAADGEVQGIYERSDVSVRELEGLEPRTGPAWGSEPPPRVRIEENEAAFWVDVRGGQKTGFYLDQRESRSRLTRGMAGKDVLNVFAYSGGFTVAVLKGGAASVQSLDSSAEALELAKENVALNGLPADKCAWTVGDAFVELRKLRDRAASFDVVILDPPRFAATAAQAERAARGYKDINLLAFKLLRPGGILCTFSCSGGVSPGLFEKIVAGAAMDAGVEAVIEEWLGQPWDHPVSLSFPEGRYLKGLVCRRIR